MADRLLITKLVGLSDTGVYSVGHQIGVLVGFLAEAVNRAWVPWLYENLKKKDADSRRRIVRITYSYFACLLLIVTLLSLVSPVVLSLLVPDAYAASSHYVFWIALGFAFSGMYMMMTNYIFVAEKTHLLSWATLTIASVNVALNYVLIRRGGALGAAQATAISNCLLFGLVWVLAARVYPMPWALKKLK
jgi:O-antigen/teichoic acid export membrane protein